MIDALAADRKLIRRHHASDLGYCPKCGYHTLIVYDFIPESLRAEFPEGKKYRCADPDCGRFCYNPCQE